VYSYRIDITQVHGNGLDTAAQALARRVVTVVQQCWARTS